MFVGRRRFRTEERCRPGAFWATPTCLDGANGLREEKGRGFLAKHNEISLSAAFVVVYDSKSAQLNTLPVVYALKVLVDLLTRPSRMAII